MIMYTIDTAFLGHLGTAQLAGSAMASLCANLVSTFLFAPAYGLNSLCSQAIGAGNPKLAGNWLQLSLGISSVMLIPSFIILFFVKDIISPFEHDKDVLKYASIFGRYSTCFLIPTFVYMAIRQYFQALQIVHPATIVSVLSVGMNLLLNQVLIYGVHIDWHNIQIEWNGLGFIGSPLATTCSLIFQLTSFCLYAVLFKQYPKKSGAWGGFTIQSFQWNRIKNFFKVIGPMMIGDATENWSYQVIVMICGILPDSDVAANTVIFNLWGILWSIFWGVGLATIVRTGKTISNGDIRGTKLIICISFALSVVINGCISLSCYVFRKELASMYTSSDDVLEILHHAIPILGEIFFVSSLSWPAWSAMEGMARNKERSLVSSITAWFIFVPGSIYLALYSPWRNIHKWSAICLIWYWALVVEVIRFVVIWWLLLRTDWEKQVMLARERSEALKKKDDAKHIRTSPKTRALIESDGIGSDDEEDRRKRTACSLHEIPNDTKTIFKSKTTDDYLCLN